MFNIIEIDNFNFKNLFNNLSLEIKENTFYTISGSNNCGKTTLMKILNNDIKGNFDNIKIFNKNINDFKIDEYSKMVQTIFPTEILFFDNNLEDEIFYLSTNTKEENEFINFLIRNLKLKKVLRKDKTQLLKKEKILYQLLIALLNKPKLLLLDNIDKYFTKKELDNLFNFLKMYKEKYGLTLLITTINLEISLYTDFIYIIEQGKIALNGTPFNVLQKDNTINKIGLSLPFMIDLSVKLRDYELVDELETDIDRMIDKLWN